jgi:L-threonylcarbamoyladenylate synthase
VIVHLDDPRYLHRWVSSLPPVAEQLAAKFWPGPLTLILPKADNVNDIVTGGQDSIGIRVPSHPMAQQLLNAFGGGIAAPSANRYGRLSPTKPEHVRDELGDAVGVILDGGDSPIGLESTIVSCLNNEARLLRPGFITRSQLEQVVGNLLVGGAAPRTPGDSPLHYAPSTPLEIVASDDLEVRAGEITARQEKVAVLAMRPPLQTQRHMTWINAGKRPDIYAHNLYNHLRTLDRAGCVRIFVQSLPQDERWAAILDRLQRASGMGDDSLELSVS